jgi:DNA-binding transcriptional LysR family regulator
VQSNVTSRIRRLEDELGTELFHRAGRGLELAAPGKVLLDYARRMLTLERQMLAAVRDAGDSVGELRIGAMETFAALHLPAALKALRHQRPGLDLRIQTDTTVMLVEQVLQHRLDCAFVAGPIVHPELAWRPLIDEELVQVHAAGSDPAGLPLILFREGCAYRARALAWQRASGHPLADVMEFGTVEGILGCVSVGLGWTLMPRRVVLQSGHAAELVVAAVPAEIGRVTTGMVTLHESPAPAALRCLGDALAGND